MKQTKNPHKTKYIYTPVLTHMKDKQFLKILTPGMMES